MGLNQQLIDQFYKRLGVNVDFEIIENLIISDSNIMRPVVGHAFEYIVADVVKNKLFGYVKDAGGDTDVDLIIGDKNGKEYFAQVKTLRSAGIKNNISFDINLHKTHGLEKRPNNLYPVKWPCPYCDHEGEAFPDLLILPHPTKGILIVPKEHIPENKTFPGHFADPAVFDWNSEWLNRWDLIGFPEYKGVQLERQSIPVQPILDKVCQRVKLSYEELLSIWLKPSNFRMIDMNLKGNLREPAMNIFLKRNGRITKLPEGSYPKYDLFCNGHKIQIKGASKSRSFSDRGTIGVEVMGSHGNGEIRRYNQTDFDYLGIVIEPHYLNMNLGLDMNEYHFCFVPVDDLPLHYRNGYEWATTDKLYDIAQFDVRKINGKVLLIPSTDYSSPPRWADNDGHIICRKPVSFRNGNVYEIDKIPF